MRSPIEGYVRTLGPRDPSSNVLGCQPFQSSSSSRSTAGWFGFLILSQWLDRPDSYREPRRFDTMPLEAELAGVLEDGGAVNVGDPVVQPQPGARCREQARQIGLAPLDRVAAQIAGLGPSSQ